MKSRASSYLVVSSVLIVLSLAGCSPSTPHPAVRNEILATTQAPSGRAPEKAVSKLSAVADDGPSVEKKRQAAEAGLTKEDLKGIWINEELDRLLLKTRSIAAILQAENRSWHVAVEFRGNDPNPVMNFNNHEGYKEKIELKDGELFCYGDDEWKQETPQGKFVLISHDGRRCIQHRRIPGIKSDFGIDDGIVFCRPRSPGADDTEKYFRGLLAGHYVLEPGGQPVVLHEDGRVEGLKGYKQYEVSFDFIDIEQEGDAGRLIGDNGKWTDFQWRWKGARLNLYSVYCGMVDANGCVLSQMKTGKILYVLRKKK